VDPGPTPTISKPFPIPNEGGFSFPPSMSSDQKGKVVEERDEEMEEVRKAALEFMVSLSEAKPAMVKRVDGWIPAVVKGCLEGMSDLDEDSTEVWLESEVGTVFIFHEGDLTLPSSLLTTLQMTLIRTSTSRLWTASLVHVVDIRCYLLHSIKYLPC
jgi:hypothetical protein